MSVGLLQPVRCLFGSHKRDGRKVVHDGEDFQSVCAGCGRPMIRTLHGWVLTEQLRREA